MSSKNRSSSKRILIVEDEGLTSLGIKSCLEETGHIVTSVVASGEEAVKKAEEERPDLVIMDILLQGEIDGIEAADRIRSRFNIPVIYLTAYSDEKMLKRIMKSGPFGYINKPFSEQELHFAVEIAFYKHEMEEALRESQTRYQTLFEGANDAIYLVDPSSMRIIDCNPKASEITGYSVSQLKNLKMTQLHPAEENGIVKKIYRKITDSGPLSGISGVNHLARDGRLVPVEINLASVEISGKEYKLAIIRDITDRKRFEDVLMQERNRLTGILDSMQDGVYIANEEYEIEYMNPLMKKEFGPVKGRKCYEYFHDRKEECPACNNKEVFSGKTIQWEWYSTQNRKTYDVIDTPIKNPDGTFSKLEILRDITRRKKMEERLRSMAITDDLTGLLNRRGFFTLTEQQCRMADRTGRMMSLLYLDLDGMKMINDHLGHHAGDLALRDTADILKRSFRRSDIIARMGGDEFAVLLTELSAPTVESIIIGHIKDNLRAHNKKGGRNFTLLFSMGIAHYDPEEPCSINDLVSQADSLMYEDKKRNRGQHILPSLNERRVYKRFMPGDALKARLNTSDSTRVKDISIGGVGLITSKRLAADSTHRIRIIGPENREIVSDGVVVRSSLAVKKDGNVPPPPYYESGFRFAEMDSEMKSSIEKLIAGLAG